MVNVLRRVGTQEPDVQREQMERLRRYKITTINLRNKQQTTNDNQYLKKTFQLYPGLKMSQQILNILNYLKLSIINYLKYIKMVEIFGGQVLMENFCSAILEDLS